MASGDTPRPIRSPWRTRYVRGWGAILLISGASGLLAAPAGLLVQAAEAAGQGSAVGWACWGLAAGYVVLAAPFAYHAAAGVIGEAVGLRQPTGGGAPGAEPAAAADGAAR